MIQIKHRWTNSVLCEFEVTDVRAALVTAVAQGADLQGADLQGADLQGADLQGADLQGAYLRGAYLQGAYLRGAYLQGAYLRGADLQGEKLAICPIFMNGTTWDITITESFLTIGCQRHEHAKWKKFTDSKIANMEGRAADFWGQNKSWLLAACKAHRKESLAFRKANPEPVEAKAA